MPPKTRGNKTLKASKENNEVSAKGKLKTSDNVRRAPRKVLADKTNSASDDNTTIPHQKISSTKKNLENDGRDFEHESPKQRRVRRMPVRYIGNPVLTNLSNSNNDASLLEDATPKKKVVKKKGTSKKQSSPASSPPDNGAISKENSILKSRPKRICRLPSKLEGHSISPSKYIPLKPVHASTPIANKISKIEKNNKPINSPINKSTDKNSKDIVQKSKKNIQKLSSGSNNNGKKQIQIDKCFERQQSIIQSKSNNTKAKSRKIANVNTSFRVFDEIKKSLKRDSSKLDPYEFTFDPDEEPPPQKKKKKRVVKKTQPKPKTVVKGAYEKNLAKALAALKNTVKDNKKDVQPSTVKDIHIEQKNLKEQHNTVRSEGNLNKSIPCENNYHSVRVEDIALDLQHNDDDDGHNIDYSPVNSPQPAIPETVNEQNREVPVNNRDPLNLQEDLSFFEDQPVASSSMNMSTKHPLASPWRVEFGSLPIKWQANTYVKPNMTPAVESSFINSSDTKKKHVYTNIIADANESLPHVDDQPSLKQTSILSFIKEVAERSANKKKKKSTPVKSNSLFEDITHASITVTPIKNISSKDSSKNSNQSTESNKEKSIEQNDVENRPDSIQKTPNKNKESAKKRNTYFGFDESEEQDQENISPIKNKRVKALRSQSRAVLQEINSLKGPSRAAIPLTVRTVLNSDNLNKNFEDPKSGTEPPVFPDKVPEANTETVINTVNNMDDDSQSVHLFEDIDLVHLYHQPIRKSYGKAKKVAFRNNSASDSDATNEVGEQESSGEEDNLEDLSFKLPVAKAKKLNKKKMTKKQKLSKKEEKEAETWAAGFNSMCEDIEEFDLVVE